jgi:1,2-phenylacetyl-CoA epoxidase PaaB subunit
VWIKHRSPLHEMDAPKLEVWEVYARHDREERAHHLGTVQAVGPRDARVFAFMMYDERRWQEMFVVPRAAVVPLIVPA